MNKLPEGESPEETDYSTMPETARLLFEHLKPMLNKAFSNLIERYAHFNKLENPFAVEIEGRNFTITKKFIIEWMLMFDLFSPETKNRVDEITLRSLTNRAKLYAEEINTLTPEKIAQKPKYKSIILAYFSQ